MQVAADIQLQLIDDFVVFPLAHFGGDKTTDAWPVFLDQWRCRLDDLCIDPLLHRAVVAQCLCQPLRNGGHFGAHAGIRTAQIVLQPLPEILP